MLIILCSKDCVVSERYMSLTYSAIIDHIGVTYGHVQASIVSLVAARKAWHDPLTHHVGVNLPLTQYIIMINHRPLSRFVVNSIFSGPLLK